MQRILLTTLCALLLPSGYASASELVDEEGAYERGDAIFAARQRTPTEGKGDVRAQYHLGMMYEDGHGVKQKYVEALKWYRLAATRGSAVAQTNIGRMYEYGRGVPRDMAEAVKCTNQPWRYV